MAGRKSALSELKKRRETKGRLLKTSDQEFWNDLYRQWQRGRIVPIVGGTVRNNRIFDLDDDDDIGLAHPDRARNSFDVLDRMASDHLSIDEELAEMWADKIGYPFPDVTNLTRVAQFNRITSDHTDQAKSKYLQFLKECLLDVAERDPALTELVQGLRTQLVSLSFSEIAAELDYPRFTQQRPDPLRELARLRLPIYITTSYHDFLERALRAEGATHVRTQFCLWNMNQEIVDTEHLPERGYAPTAQEPVVYHLHGYEEYPASLVLSEDDYLDYLLALAHDTNANQPLIPPYIRTALEVSSLLLLGYRLQDWDFRILYRGLINAQHGQFRELNDMYGIAIQLDPKFQTEIQAKAEARQYLNDYFKDANFRVEWSSIDRFIAMLWAEFDKRRR